MTWKSKIGEIYSHNDLPDECTHIVYKVHFTDGTKYIGYKTVRSMRRLKPTKAQLAIRKNYKRVELKELPFIDYTGSSKENDGKVVRYKEILHFCSNKRTATYLETQLLFEANALTNEYYNNKNIGGKWFDNCLDGFIS